MQVMNVDAISVFLQGHTLGDYLQTMPGHWPPLYPLLVYSLDTMFSNIELSSKIVSILSGLLLALAVLLLTDQLFGRTAAYIAFVLVLFHPVLTYYSLFTTTELTYLFYWYISLFLFVRLIKTPRLSYALLLGGTTAATYLTRAEGILLFAQLAFLLALAVVYAWYKKPEQLRYFAAALVLFGISFVFVAAPYLLFLKEQLGRWSISRVSGSVLVIDRATTEERIFALTPDKKEITGYLHSDYDDQSFWDTLRTNPSFLLNKWQSNIKHLLIDLLPQIFIHRMIFYLSLAVALMVFLFYPAYRWSWLLLMLQLAPMTITPFYVVELRTQIYTVLPFLILLAFAAARLGERFQPERIKVIKTVGGYPKVTTIVLVVMVSVAFYQVMAPRVAHKGSYGLELKKAGLWLQQSGLPAGAVINRKPWVAYYSQNPILKIPDAGYADIMHYARANNARYLVIDDIITTTVRPHLKFLLDQETADLELVFDNQREPGQHVRVFRITPKSNSNWRISDRIDGHDTDRLKR
jgi:hypothetical protein